MQKTLLVTGGSRGIGAAVCRLAARDGFDVAVNYVNNLDAAEQVVADIERIGRKAIVIQGDVAIENDIIAMFEQAENALSPLTGFVNNAGVVDMKSRIDEMSVERLERMMRINVIGSILCAREAVKRMSTKHGGKGGAIVNISSAAAQLGSPNRYVDYAASKGAIDTLTVGLAKEVAQEGIRVNGVRPGIIDTEIHANCVPSDHAANYGDSVPMKRAGNADEVAEAIVWLLSDAASYCTGTTINVSGGR